MSVDALFYIRKDEPASSFRDLDDVVLLSDAMTDDGITLPAGTEGTVVAVWRGGAAYEVEFAKPPGSLANVPAEHLARAPRA